MKDGKHRFLLVNDSFCRFPGRCRDELIGRTDHDFFPKEQAELCQAMDDKVFATGEENISEEELGDGKGCAHTVIIKKALCANEAGEKHIVGIIRDISEQKKLAQQLHQRRKWRRSERLPEG